MLLKGYLAGTLFYPSIAHSYEIINTYISELEYVFHKISDEKGNIRIKDILEVPVVHSGFKRLNYTMDKKTVYKMFVTRNP